MKIAIVGGGIAGLTAAIALKKKGFETIIFESAPEIKAVGAGLVLAGNAIKAYDALGLKDELIKHGRLLESFRVLDKKGKTISETKNLSDTGATGENNFTIHRADLHAFLLEQIDNDSIRLNKKLIDISKEPNGLALTFADDTICHADYAIIADGIHSAARLKYVPESTPRYAGYTCWRAVINSSELNITETSETWGSNGRFGIAPLSNNRIYWFAVVKSPQNNQEYKNYTVKNLLKQFEGYHPSVSALLNATNDEDLLWNDIIDIKPIDTLAFDRMVLIGDAGHATTPNMGQGACQAIEDAVYLAKYMEENKSIQEAFKVFEKNRLKRVHWVVNTSWNLGKVAQNQNPVFGAIRNFLFRLIPESVNKKQLQKITEVEF